MKEKVEQIIAECVEGTDIFLVKLTVSSSNDINVLLDSDSGLVLGDCRLISRDIESSLDREKEDFSLTEILDSSDGSVVIYIGVDIEDENYYPLLAHEVFHLLNPYINDWYMDSKRIGDGVKVDQGFEYSSYNNKEWMEISELRDWIKTNSNKIGNI